MSGHGWVCVTHRETCAPRKGFCCHCAQDILSHTFTTQWTSHSLQQGSAYRKLWTPSVRFPSLIPLDFSLLKPPRRREWVALWEWMDRVQTKVAKGKVGSLGLGEWHALTSSLGSEERRKRKCRGWVSWSYLAFPDRGRTVKEVWSLVFPSEGLIVLVNQIYKQQEKEYAILIMCPSAVFKEEGTMVEPSL